MNYRIARNGKVIGKISKEKLQLAVDKNKILSSDHIYSDSLGEWHLLSDIANKLEIDLSSSQIPAPPKLNEELLNSTHKLNHNKNSINKGQNNFKHTSKIIFIIAVKALGIFFIISMALYILEVLISFILIENFKPFSQSKNPIRQILYILFAFYISMKMSIYSDEDNKLQLELLYKIAFKISGVLLLIFVVVRLMPYSFNLTPENSILLIISIIKIGIALYIFNGAKQLRYQLIKTINQII